MVAPAIAAGARIAAGSSARGISNAAKITGRKSTSVRVRKARRLRQGLVTSQQAQEVAGKIEEKDGASVKSPNKMLFRAAFVPVRMSVVYFIVLQLFFGIATLFALTTWFVLDDWSWGLAGYALPTETVTTAIWGISVFFNLGTLAIYVFIFLMIGRLPIFKTPVTFGMFVLAFILAMTPFTGFVSAAALFAIAVYLKFR